MKNFLLIIGLLIILYSCIPCCDNASVTCLTKYYIGDSCTIAEHGIFILGEKEYNLCKSECDEIESYTIYQEHFVRDIFRYNYYGDTLQRYLEFIVNDTTMEQGASILGRFMNNELNEQEILKNIDICDIDSIVFEDIWDYD